MNTYARINGFPLLLQSYAMEKKSIIDKRFGNMTQTTKYGSNKESIAPVYTQSMKNFLWVEK